VLEGAVALSDGESVDAISGNGPHLTGLAFRYGKLVVSTARKVTVLPLPNARKSLSNNGATREAALELSTLDAPLCPHPHSLCLAHGNAYLLAEGGVLRLNLAGNQGGQLSVDRLLLVEPLAMEPAISDELSHGHLVSSSGLTPPPNASIIEDWDDWDEPQQIHESGIPDNGSATVPEEFGNSYSGAQGTNNYVGSAERLDCTNVLWEYQAATSESWMALGTKGNAWLAVAYDAAYAVFTATRLPTPPIPPGETHDLIAWQGSFVLIGEQGLWRLLDLKWVQLWQCPDSQRVRGAVVYEQNLYVWGQSPHGVWVRQVRVDGSASPPSTVKAGEIYHHPVRLGSVLYFFSHSVDGNHILTLNLNTNYEPRQPYVLPSKGKVVWALGAEGSRSGRENDWLTYAVDDDTGITFYALAAGPTANAAWQVGDKVRPLRHSNQSSIAATIADGRLVIAATTNAETTLRAFELSQETPSHIS
jgi:hypothetical protein